MIRHCGNQKSSVSLNAHERLNLKSGILRRSFHGKNFIGNTISAKGNHKFQGVEASTWKQIDPLFTEATNEEIIASLNLASNAFSSIKQKTNKEVASFLREINKQLQNRQAKIIERAMIETSYPQPRLQNEFLRTTNQIEMFAQFVEEGSFVEPRILQIQGKPDLRRMLVPIGPVSVFGASNFPLAFSVAGGDTASAFAAKCPVVVKAHQSHPGTSELVAEGIIEAVKASDMPNGTFSLLHGGANVGQALVKHPLTKAVGFTGSYKAGRALFDLAARRDVPIPVYAEMGSINPVIILPEALQTKAANIAEGLSGSVCLTVGQFCTNPGLVLAVGKQTLSASFLDLLKSHMSQVPVASMLNKSIHDSYVHGVQHLAKQQGVQVLLEAKTEGTKVGPALLTVDAKTFVKNAKVLQEEVFGPSTLVVRCETYDEALACLHSLGGQLTGTIHATEQELQASNTKSQVDELLSALQDKVGRIIFGGYPTGVEVTPAMTHGGPFPATTSAGFTSVGTESIKRWLRPVTYQTAPQFVLPDALKDGNPQKIWRLENNTMTK